MARKKKTSDSYRNALERFERWLKKNLKTNLQKIKKPFNEYSLCLYFVHSITKQRNKGLGVCLATIKNDLTAFKHFCNSDNNPIPLLNYNLLENLLQGIKHHERNRIKKKKYIIQKYELDCMLNKLSLSFEDTVWHLALTFAWTTVLRTGEWSTETKDPQNNK